MPWYEGCCRWRLPGLGQQDFAELFSFSLGRTSLLGSAFLAFLTLADLFVAAFLLAIRTSNQGGPENHPKMGSWPICPADIIDSKEGALAELMRNMKVRFGIVLARVDLFPQNPGTKAALCERSPGMHFNVRHRTIKNRVGRLAFINSIYYCKCCDDSSGKPIERQDWKVGKA